MHVFKEIKNKKKQKSIKHKQRKLEKQQNIDMREQNAKTDDSLIKMFACCVKISLKSQKRKQHS